MILTEGTYYIADDCKAYYRNRALTVFKMTKEQLEKARIRRCRDCKHQKVGKLCMRSQRWETPYCELKPKIIEGEAKYFYNAPDTRAACEKFEEKEEQR